MDNFYNLHDRALRAIAGRPLPDVIIRTRAIVGPPLENLEGEAHDGLAALKKGVRPTAQQVAALEAIIRSMRPSLLSNSGQVDPLPAEAEPVFADWSRFLQHVLPHLYTIGRIDRVSRNALPAEPYGTGFLIAPDLVLTNRHVVTLLSGGTDIINAGDAEVRFRYEYNAPDEAAVQVAGVARFHDEEDAAVLRLASSEQLRDRTPLPWSKAPPRVSDALSVIGYPSRDKRNPLFADRIFGDKLDVKRIAPGELIGARHSAIYHDCSTLGGNSGSPVVDMKSGLVVGLHRDGAFLARNEAVSATALQSFISRPT
jgi:V8-like Glu-specific endopeptidase